MENNTIKIVTTRTTKTITVTEDELSDILRDYFKMPNATVDYDIRQGSFLGSVAIQEVTEVSVHDQA